MLLYTFPSLALLVFPQAQQPEPIFDGVSLSGWEASEEGTWRVEGGAIVGGSLKRPISSNSYLFSAAEYSDFELKFQFKLEGFPEQGMVNSGVQFRSQRLEDGHARGYQADIGDPAWWGSIYDEQRRNRVIAASDMSLLEPVLNRGDWNEYVIRCEGPHIRLWINGVETVDYTETESGIARSGRIALQIHSGGPAQVSFRDITLLKIKAPESPLSPADQLASFRVPEGFVVELVASEETGLPKPITVQFDDAGRMWSITATEYPLDANESPEEAQALWRQGGRDKVVVIDRPHEPGPHVARTFVDGLAMPMGLWPWKEGVGGGRREAGSGWGSGPTGEGRTSQTGDGRREEKKEDAAKRRGPLNDRCSRLLSLSLSLPPPPPLRGAGRGREGSVS